MLQRHHVIVQRALFYMDTALVFAAWTLGVKTRLKHPDMANRFANEEGLAQFLQLGLAIAVCMGIYQAMGLYHRSRRISHIMDEVGRQVLANGIAGITLMAALFLLDLPTVSRLQIFLFVLINTAFVVTTRVCIRLFARYLRRRGYNYRNLVLVANPKRDVQKLLDKVRRHDYWGFRVLGVIRPGEAAELTKAPIELKEQEEPVELCLENAEMFFDRNPVDEIWVDGPPDEENEIFEFIAKASDRGAKVRYLLARNFVPGVRWGFESYDTLTTLAATRTSMDDFAVVIKRGIDVVAASLIILMTSPFMLLASLLLMCDRSSGGVLFKQERVGLNGRRFMLLKFRTMVPNAEAMKEKLQAQNEIDGPAFKMKNDPRITRLGRNLRKYSIDELPQLFNVLRGDMSLVGPRPPLPKEVDVYERTQRRRLSVKPGITGLWQVSGRNKISSFEDWVELDLSYIEHWSLKLDFRIMIMTIPAILMARGAS